MRTALPTVKKLKEFETITLTGKATDGTEISESFYSERYKIVPSRGGSSSGGTGIPVGNIGKTPISGGGAVAKVEVRSAYEKMKDAMIPVEKGKTYEFTLTAIAGGAVWQNTVTKTVVAGENTLSFSLSLLSIGATSYSQVGRLSVLLEVSSSVVHGASCALFNMDGTIPDWSDITDYDYDEDLYIEFANDADENVSLNVNVNVNGNGNGGIALGMPDCYVGYKNYLPVGNYVLVFTLSTLTRTMAVL